MVGVHQTLYVNIVMSKHSYSSPNARFHGTRRFISVPVQTDVS